MLSSEVINCGGIGRERERGRGRGGDRVEDGDGVGIREGVGVGGGFVSYCRFWWKKIQPRQGPMWDAVSSIHIVTLGHRL